MRAPAWLHAALYHCAPLASLVLAVISMPALPILYWRHRLDRDGHGIRFVEKGG